jgi:CRISPR-associated protein Cas2
MAEERAFYVLAYDIASDKRRAKIARLMESLGLRVQGSVFEAYLTPAELEKLIRRARKALLEKEDSLRIYTLCAACRAKVRTIGLGEVTPPPGVVIV